MPLQAVRYIPRGSVCTQPALIVGLRASEEKPDPSRQLDRDGVSELQQKWFAGRFHAIANGI